MESITVGFSQVFYDCIHMQHHKGNSDRPDETGETVDWMSIYKHGGEGEAEHPLKVHVPQFFPGRSENGLSTAETEKPKRSLLGQINVPPAVRKDPGISLQTFGGDDR